MKKHHKYEDTKSYTENLKRGVVTDEMVADVLYSFNKRAKNYRDRIRKISQDAHYYGRRQYDERNLQNCEEKMDTYYEKKDKILRHYPEKMVCIHRLTTQQTIRFYIDDEEYDEYVNTDYVIDSGVREYYDEYLHVYCSDPWIKIRREEHLYFVYYDFSSHSFHHPIEKRDLKHYHSLEVVDIDELVTKGEDIGILLSCQFCDKVYDFITQKNEMV